MSSDSGWAPVSKSTPSEFSLKNSTLSTISTLKFLHYLPATHPQNHLTLTSHPSSASFFASHLPTCAPIGVPTKSSEDIIFYIQKYFFSTKFQSSNWLQTGFNGLVSMSWALFCRFVAIWDFFSFNPRCKRPSLWMTILISGANGQIFAIFQSNLTSKKIDLVHMIK
jgi:hypothetical protein